MSIESIKKDTRARMAKSVQALNEEMGRVRTGRANTGLVDNIKVDYYGTPMPINQVANVSVSDSRTITVSPWEKTMVAAVDKAIRESDLGLNPVSQGDLLRIPLPPLTEERRKDLIKVVRNESEQSKIAVRNIRRDAITQLRNMIKSESLAEDMERKGEAEIQKLTDQYVAEIDQVLKDKEKDLLEI